ncbi:MAG: hypothetical protein JNL60_13875 [Bacteroidia bacterium]|nr:hypothetical protein [Bacteroidia bacterium]
MKELRAIFILFIAILSYNSQAQNCLNDGFESMSPGAYSAGNSVPGVESYKLSLREQLY